MDESFIARIRDYAKSQARPAKFAPAAQHNIEEAEKGLGFSIPTLLSAVYRKVGNGGFGPGRGGRIIGLKGGYESDFGNLLETYRQLKGDHELEGKKWKAGLLPFCEWGCNMFSCVDCKSPDNDVYLFEEGSVERQDYNLEDFFKMCVEGVDILSHGAAPSKRAEIVNPFTGKKAIAQKRRGKK
jgi:hypothetical protein